jgi:hypothetical protein
MCSGKKRKGKGVKGIVGDAMRSSRAGYGTGEGKCKSAEPGLRATAFLM